ncbi:MAG: DUF4936 family protein [Candidatus Aquirickettsiella gammari]
MDCYIYYKAKEGDAQQIQTCVARLVAYVLENISMQCGIAIAAPQLQRRPAASNGVHTWMEIYRDVPMSFEQIIQDAASASGIDQHLIGERRLEYFIDQQFVRCGE